jgi:hypothetical protein
MGWGSLTFWLIMGLVLTHSTIKGLRDGEVSYKSRTFSRLGNPIMYWFLIIVGGWAGVWFIYRVVLAALGSYS